MTWHTATVPMAELNPTVVEIRNAGGTITNFCPCVGSVLITWTTIR
ncbi:hypothetical protein [Nocardioides sp. Root140]|nr:hypothetical protein [Nocardioides sp. Root140]